VKKVSTAATNPDPLDAYLQPRPRRRPTATESPGSQILLVSQADAGRMLAVSRYTIRRMVSAGMLHPVQLLGATRYRVAEIAALAGGHAAPDCRAGAGLSAPANAGDPGASNGDSHRGPVAAA